MGLDNDQNGCEHDWQLVELVPDKRPGDFIPTLSQVSECTLCGAVDYAAHQRDPNRERLS